MKVYGSHQRKRTYVNSLSVRVTIIQLVLTNFLAIRSFRLPSELFITVNPTENKTFVQVKKRHDEDFPYLFCQGTNVMSLP